ncbi:MAG TPA: aldehyde dehydrogenase family protein [Planctomycetota bacterium]|nr:aldehyde dehydrogenase family protein [Planctomycetota bacterium]
MPHVTSAAPPKIASRKILLDGKWTDSSQKLSVVSPWTGEVVSEVPDATSEQARAAGEAARKVLPAMRAMSASKRAEALQAIAQKIVQRGDEIAQAICNEVAKPMWLSQVEVQRAVNVFRIAAEEALRLPGEVIYPDREPQGAGMVGRLQYFPLGPILGITPFNFPLNLVAHKVAPALAAGCPIVIKPPPQGPSAALILGEIVLESGFPPAALQVLTGGLAAGQALCASDAFSAVSFTGSARAGWSIKKNALARQKVLLELGGNAAVIVDETAELEPAAKAVSTAGYIYAGQICISTQRVFVHKNVYDAFERRLAEKILTEVPVSSKASDEKAFVGPLIDKNSADRVESWINSALAKGATPLIKGTRHGERLISPWLLENVPADEPLSCEEVFGPVVIMQKVDSLQEAIALTNASRYGLQASVFTQSLRNAELAYREIEAGAVLVNVPTAFRIDAALYGGTKDSGFGREGVAEVIREFSEPKLLVVKP